MEGFDPAAMVARFKERAEAVRRRGLPPVEGEERRRVMAQAALDFQDFAMLGDAVAELVDGVLTLRVDLRPQPDAQRSDVQGPDAQGSDAQGSDAQGSDAPSG